MNTRFVPPGSSRNDPARVLILGEPGVGKTRLAATFPNPLFIDIEQDGSASALPEPPARIVIRMSKTTLKDTIDTLKALQRKPTGPHSYSYEGVSVETVIIDPIDQIQRAVQTWQVLKGKDTMQMRDWGKLLEMMYPLVLEWSSLTCNLVVVGHVNRRGDEENKQVVEAMLAVKGSLRRELPGWFSMILHVTAGVEGRRYVVPQPMISKGVKYTAKDRHNILGALKKPGSPYIEITSKTGWPTIEIADLICKGNDDDTKERTNEAS